MTRGRLRTRLMIIYLVLLSLALLALGVQVYRWSAADLLTERRIRLLTEARMVGDVVAPSLDSSEAASRILESYGRRFDARLLLLDADRVVSGDSLAFSPDGQILLDQRLMVDEVEQAMGGQAASGVYRDRSSSPPQYVQYVAVPVLRGGQIQGVLLMVDSLEPILGALQVLMQRLMLAGGVIVVLFGGVTVVVAHRLTRPLHEIRRAARQLGTGDLTARVVIKTRDEFREVGDAFNTMAEDLEAQDRRQRQFISDASHELRSPVSSALLLLEAMERAPERSPELQASLAEQLERMSRLVTQLLELTRLDELRPEAEPSESAYTDVNHVVERVIRRFKPVADAQCLTLEHLLPPVARIAGDPEHLERIFQNLVENALKFTPSGGEIRVSVTVEPDTVNLRISDTGSGIDRTHLAHIFDRFYRADVARTRDQGSFGLGLAIVFRRVESLGGDIQVDSEPGAGTSFYLRFPRLS